MHTTLSNDVAADGRCPACRREPGDGYVNEAAGERCVHPCHELTSSRHERYLVARRDHAGVLLGEYAIDRRVVDGRVVEVTVRDERNLAVEPELARELVDAIPAGELAGLPGDYVEGSFEVRS